MRRLRLAGAVTVFGAAAVAAFSGEWPWRRLDLPVAQPIVVQPVTFTETLDTLRRGETISELLARQGVSDLDITAVDSAPLDPRRLRSGLVFSFRRAALDSTPTRITVRTSPAQRVSFRRDS
nr:hypothetical protein [Gemmatimonadales bacterium]